ncbi:MAG: type VI secretion system protein TssA [gamma proteobacterium symbiont of Ctena orbiculata]
MTATIDLEQLLTPVSDEAPAGTDLEYDPMFGEMERAAEGKEEQEFGDTVIPAEDPDWRELKKRALQVVEQSKDLRAAIHLTRALMHTDGFAGFSDGLSLIKGYIENYWESLHPQLDPDDNNDPTLRINTLVNLCDPIDTLGAVSKIPLVSSTVMGKYSYRDIQIALGNLQATDADNQEVALDQVDAAFRECPSEESQRTLSHIRAAIESVNGIESRLNELVGVDNAPNLQSLTEHMTLLEKEVATRTGVDIQAEGSSPDGSGPAAQQQGSSPGVINSRDDVISTLEKINQYYRKHEPSSPIPLLLDRAKRLVKMDFYEIVQDLAPDGMQQFDFLWKQEDR